MHRVDELFDTATVEELSQGYKKDGDQYVCLLCGQSYIKGQIYPMDEVYYDAEHATIHHITQAHGSVFDRLLDMGKRSTGLSDVQRSVVELLYMGKSDDEIARTLGGRAKSTIRNHRFALRERKQRAKIFLAIMQNLEDKREEEKTMTIHKGATMRDDRFDITEKDRDQVLKVFVKDGKLTQLPAKEKKKLIVIQELFVRFERGRDYTEREVNEVIKTFYHDYATLRRYLIEYGYLERENDCSRYWVK